MHNRLLTFLLIFITTTILFGIVYKMLEIGEFNIAVFGWLCLTVICCIWMFSLILDKKGGPIGLISAFFFTSAYAIPGLANASTGIYYWNANIYYSDQLSFTTSMISSLFVLTFALGMRYSASRTDLQGRTFVVSSGIVRWLMFFFILLSFLSFQRIGATSFLSTRKTLLMDVLDEGGTTFLGLFVNMPRALSVVIFLLFIFTFQGNIYFSRKQRNVIYLLFMIALPAALLFLFPTAAPRFILVALVLSASLIIMNYAQPLQKSFFVLLLIFGFFILLPATRSYNRGLSVDGSKIQLYSIEDVVLHGDLDGPQMVQTAYAYTNSNGYSYGRQILGGFLVFVPRSIWLDKPESSGSVTSFWAGFGFYNVSMPIIGEIYLDFGIVGIVLGGWFLGQFYGRVDRIYLHEQQLRKPDRLGGGGILFNAIIAGFMPILLRGSFIGIASYIVVIYVLLAVFYRTARKIEVPN